MDTYCVSGSQRSSSALVKSFNFEGVQTTPSEGTQSPSLHGCFPEGGGARLKHPQPVVYEVRKSQGSTSHSTVISNVVTSNDSEISF